MVLGGDTHRGAVKELRPRLLLAMLLVALAFLVLVGRLYSLQILSGEEWANRGRRNFVQRVRIPHDRGIIYDRHGNILVDNRLALDAYVTPAFLGGAEARMQTLHQLAAILKPTDAERQRLYEQLEAVPAAQRFQPVLAKKDLSPGEIEAIQARRSVFELDGVDIVETRRRLYPHGKLAAHLLGYVNEIDRPALEREKARGNPQGYKLGDLIGRDGVERTFEADLRGVDGWEQVVVDAKGRRLATPDVTDLVGETTQVVAQPGRNVVLTLDLELQRAAEQSFTGQAGAVVVVAPRTGEILALAGVPAFDPNLVSAALGLEEKERLDADPLKPWVKRPVQGQYAPGSTFKVVTALAALETQTTSVKEKVFCPGWFKMGRHVWRCHQDSGHGHVDLRQAIKLSCDTYFYTMAARMGIEPIARMARRMGLGQRSGIDVRGEQVGLVPDEAFHDKVDAATGGYQRGMAINTAIGQGSLLVTPLQLAMAYSTLVNGGERLRPQILRRVETADFRVVRQALPSPAALSAPQPMMGGLATEILGEPPQVVRSVQPERLGSIDVDPQLVDAVREGLVAVTSEPGGTAYWRRSRLVSMGGKTGTSQVIRLERERLEAEEMDYFQRDHAWFVAYAPAEDPEIVVAVLNEHSGHGGSKAAPIATVVIDRYFDLQRLRLAALAPAAEAQTQ